MSIDYPALKTEIQTDPVGLGYAPLMSNHNEIAKLLNTVTQTLVDLVALERRDLIGLVVAAEYLALSDAQRDLWSMILLASDDGVLLQDARVMAMLDLVWAVGTQTRTNIAQTRRKRGTRAEVLFGAGAVVRPEDIGRALRG